MPEILEAEIWREALGDLVGRRITSVTADERVVDASIDAAVGQELTAVRRHGKVVLVDTSGPTIGFRFGMTGRIVVDGAAPIESLEYASSADRPEWDRLTVWTDPSANDRSVPAIRMNDPRRLGRVVVDPDVSDLGPDVFGIDRVTLARALAGRRSALKVALMNQRIVAGLGNLCTDEVLFAAGLDPRSPAGSLEPGDVTALHRAIRRRLPAMLAAGGSTTGLLDPDRRRLLGRCPRRGCSGHLSSSRLGGRTTVWCAEHQLTPS